MSIVDGVRSDLHEDPPDRRQLRLSGKCASNVWTSSSDEFSYFKIPSLWNTFCTEYLHAFSNPAFNGELYNFPQFPVFITGFPRIPTVVNYIL